MSGDRPDPEQIFRLTSLQCFSGGSGAPSLLPISPAHTPGHNMPHRQVDTVLMETPQDTLVRPFDSPSPCPFKPSIPVIHILSTARFGSLYNDGLDCIGIKMSV